MSFVLLFDLDGTLVDTDPLHFEAYQRLLAEAHRPPIDFALYESRIMGFGHAEIFAMLFPEAVAEHGALAERKEAIFRSLLQGKTVESRAGLPQLVAWVKQHRIPCGVVTNAPRDNAALLLRALGLEAVFDTIVLGEELAHPKPHPMPYQTGLRRLGGDAAVSMAFEDSLSGVRSAAAAGLYTVGVTATLADRELRAAGAAHTIADFDDATLWSLLRTRLTSSGGSLDHQAHGALAVTAADVNERTKQS